MSTRTEHRAKIAEARNVLGEVIARARFAGEPTVLINRGKEAAAIVGHDFYVQAQEDRRTVEALHRLLAEMPNRKRAEELHDDLARVRDELAAADS
ncbi:type II toxin-antitoxin system prevent-host-death family antitoxin [Streptomyces sp. 549]|uniref:type II toxin-antitoxin system prevent-host-death family antitoxin n=1 Tax=Streptomyces sp. 549 TaxID=3049076 RepID=UPI0024C44576|nr:type II toxin-antitoxin system prevent-host-death family antitoxin [Streptomyces sp. 549]MDK1473670.1 type II toxin-antitoxin system prevent-host-death family antitoxin [Streptomyces sp. 549]